MNNIGKRIGAIFCVLLLAATYAQAQDQVCFVIYSYEDTEAQRRSSAFGLAEFGTFFTQEEITKSFKHDESKVTVNVGVFYSLASTVSKEYTGISLAIAFSGEPKNVFDEVGGARASVSEINLKKHSLALSKSVAAGNRIWTFQLSCVPRKDVPYYKGDKLYKSN